MKTIYGRQYHWGAGREDIIDTTDGLSITTEAYESQQLSGESDVRGQDFTSVIREILNGETPNPQDVLLQLENANYPHGIKGKIRHEALTSIGYTTDDGDVEFITRKRPSLERSNTPGAEDAGIIFHGIDGNNIISPKRFIADMTSKAQDSMVSEEEIESFHDSYGALFQSFTLRALGHLVLTSGSVAREQEVPTSAIMQANLIQLTQEQVETILEINRAFGNNNYTLRSMKDRNLIKNPANGEIIPKLEAYRDCLDTLLPKKGKLGNS